MHATHLDILTLLTIKSSNSGSQVQNVHLKRSLNVLINLVE